MKKAFILLLVIGAGFLYASSQQLPPMELWNKTSKPLYFAAVSTKSPSDDKVMSEPLTQLPAGKYVTADSNLIDINKYTRLLITQDPDANLVTVHTFNPGKHIWVRQKSGDVFGPQTGPFMGFTGDTERGYPKDKNVTSSDYTSKELKRSAWQKVKKAAKGSLYGYTISE